MSGSSCCSGWDARIRPRQSPRGSIQWGIGDSIERTSGARNLPRRRSEMNDVDLKERKVSDRQEGGRGHGPWEVNVFVYLHSDTAGDFTVESYLQSNPDSSKLVFHNRFHPGLHLKLHLIDEH